MKASFEMIIFSLCLQSWYQFLQDHGGDWTDPILLLTCLKHTKESRTLSISTHTAWRIS